MSYNILFFYYIIIDSKSAILFKFTTSIKFYHKVLKYEVAIKQDPIL